MSREEADVAGKVVRMLTERDPFEDGEAHIHFRLGGTSPPGILHGPAGTIAVVADRSEEDAGLSGVYEILVTARRIR